MSVSPTNRGSKRGSVPLRMLLAAGFVTTVAWVAGLVLVLLWLVGVV